MEKVKYTEELTAKVTELFEGGTSLEDIAKETGKTVPSLRAKLASMGLYKAKSKTRASGEARETRETLVRKLESYMDIEENTLESLEKARKSDLELLVNFFGKGE